LLLSRLVVSFRAVCRFLEERRRRELLVCRQEVLQQAVCSDQQEELFHRGQLVCRLETHRQAVIGRIFFTSNNWLCREVLAGGLLGESSSLEQLFCRQQIHRQAFCPYREELRRGRRACRPALSQEVYWNPEVCHRLRRFCWSFTWFSITLTFRFIF
jgi:hypothetical protein